MYIHTLRVRRREIECERHYLVRQSIIKLRYLIRLHNTNGKRLSARCSWSQVSAFEHYRNLPLTSPLSQTLYPVHGANLTLIQPMWSAYPYAPTSLYIIHMPLLPYMVIQPIVLGMALLWAAIDSALSQGPLLWRHNDMTVIVSRNTRGRERDTRQRLDNANARRLQTVNR